MFTKFFKPQITRWMGVILIGAMLLGIPAATVSAATPTPTQTPPTTQPAGQSKVTPANLAFDYQKETQALQTQDSNLTKVDKFLGKADTFLTNLKDKGRDVEILQTVLNQFKQDVTTATGFHDTAAQILNVHAGFDSSGNVVDQTQALTTVLCARDKLMEARLTLKGGIADVRDAIQFYRTGSTSNSQSTPTATPAPVQ
jgi:hypothetical protein